MAEANSYKAKRLQLWSAGMAELAPLKIDDCLGRNGESLATDEAAVWKRVLSYRIARFLKPRAILETHPGVGVGTQVYRRAAFSAKILTPNDLGDACPELIDIDPFGQPWDALNAIEPAIKTSVCLQVSNGEAQAVVRNLRRAQRYATHFVGRRMPDWVVHEYVPRLEEVTGLQCAFFYAFPTTVRVILARINIPQVLWRGCPRWMWWLDRYAPQ